MRFIDLSLPIDENNPEAHPIRIERLTHRKGIEHLTGTVTHLPGKSGSFTMPPLVREKEKVSLAFEGTPGDLVTLGVSSGTGTFFSKQLKGQWLLSLYPAPQPIP